MKREEEKVRRRVLDSDAKIWTERNKHLKKQAKELNLVGLIGAGGRWDANEE